MMNQKMIYLFKNIIQHQTVIHMRIKEVKDKIRDALKKNPNLQASELNINFPRKAIQELIDEVLQENPIIKMDRDG